MSEAKKSRLFLYGTLEPKDHDLDEVRKRESSCGCSLIGIALMHTRTLATYNQCSYRRDTHMLTKRLEKCYGDLSGVTSRLRENELFNHLNDKVRVGNVP